MVIWEKRKIYIIAMMFDIYSSIVATKLDSNKIINHYSDIIEEEINSEENNEDNKIYVLTPK